MKTLLHSDAATALNAIADAISLDFPPKNPPGSGLPWGQLHASTITRDDMIGAPRFILTDGLGTREGIFAEVRGQKVSITGESLSKLSTLIERVLGVSSLSDLLS